MGRGKIHSLPARRFPSPYLRTSYKPSSYRAPHTFASRVEQVTPKASTLARDYRCPAVPDAVRNVYLGHCTGVKCVTFVGEESFFLASGDGDGDVKLWPTNPSGAGAHDEEDRDADENGDVERRGVAGWGRHGVRACGDGLSAGGEAVERRGMENDGVGVRTQWSRESSREEEVGAVLTFRASGGKGKVRVRCGVFRGRMGWGAGVDSLGVLHITCCPRGWGVNNRWGDRRRIRAASR